MQHHLVDTDTADRVKQMPAGWKMLARYGIALGKPLQFRIAHGGIKDTAGADAHERHAQGLAQRTVDIGAAGVGLRKQQNGWQPVATPGIDGPRQGSFRPVAEVFNNVEDSLSRATGQPGHV